MKVGSRVVDTDVTLATEVPHSPAWGATECRHAGGVPASSISPIYLRAQVTAEPNGP